jgi:hypothetical protein
MEELLKSVAEHFGFLKPFVYAAGIYKLFSWFDQDASDGAKGALAKTMTLRDYDKKQVADALVEVFDRLYSYPLFSFRAFFRSMLFTVVITAIYAFEFLPAMDYLRLLLSKIPVLSGFVIAPTGFVESSLLPALQWGAILYGMIFSTNVLTDYLSLFVIRPWLARCGVAPVFALITAALFGFIIVNTGAMLRAGVLIGYILYLAAGQSDSAAAIASDWLYRSWWLMLPTVIPALAVFAWLPLFAVGILAIRALTPLSWLVEKTRWALKDGEEHPLKAIGYVAALIVFIVAATLREL